MMKEPSCTLHSSYPQDNRAHEYSEQPVPMVNVHVLNRVLSANVESNFCQR